METPSEFQRRASQEGREAQSIAARVVTACGFKILHGNKVHPTTGVTINIVARSLGDKLWYFDVVGSVTSSRAGFLRTDSVWKALGRASVLSLNGVEPLILLTSNLPNVGSVGDKALRATQGQTFFDALEIQPSETRRRLRTYARAESVTRPLPGFWSLEDLYGEHVAGPNIYGAQMAASLQLTRDPFGSLLPASEIRRMPHRLKVFVPTQSRDGSGIPAVKREQVLRDVVSVLTDLGGGCTSQQAEGTWINPLGGLAEERVTVLEVYTTIEPPHSSIRAIVDKILMDLDQEAVSLVVGTNMYLFRR